MRAKIFSLILVVTLALAGLCMAGDSDVCKTITLASLKKHVPIPPAKIVSKREVNGLCEVIMDIKGELVPVYATEKYVIAGEMFENRTQVTQSQINQINAKKFLTLKEQVDKCVAMTVKPKAGAVRKTVYLITDPVCPYCHRAESKLKEYADKYGAEFKLVLYSVHPPIGRQKAIEAVCRGLSAEQYLADAWKKENKTQDYQCEKGKKLISETEHVVRELGVRGVPMFYLSDGTLIRGANMRALARALGRGEKKLSYAR